MLSVKTSANITRWNKRSTAPWATQNSGSMAAPDPPISPSYDMREHTNCMISFFVAKSKPLSESSSGMKWLKYKSISVSRFVSLYI